MIVIGDIHGHLTHLQKLIQKLPKDKGLLFLGDYIDRGPNSAGVIRYLKELSFKRDCIFLKGNHEDMLINSWDWNGAGELDYSNRYDPRVMWAGNGGTKTEESYKKHAVGVNIDIEWYKSLKLYHEDENGIYIHGGIDFHREMKDQNPEYCLWVREPFYKNFRMWNGKRIFFGHTPTKYLGMHTGQVYFSSGKKIVGLDTGCYNTGWLSAIDSETLEVWQYYEKV